MIQVKIKGMEKLQRKLKKLAKSAANRASRKAVRAGGTVLRKAIKANTPVDEGLLKKAMDLKVFGKRGKFGAVIGANVAKLNADAEASGKNASGDAKRPTNIDWLVEFGHTDPDGTVVPPSGFMRTAAESAMPAAEKATVDKLRQEIEREATR